MAKYLDTTGLQHLWDAFKSRLLPSGGTAGQVLAKSSGTDYDVGWVTPSGGGTAIETAETSVSLSNIGSGTKTLYLEREGSIVHASFTATATAATANSAISCGTVPSGYRPTASEFQSGICMTNNTLSGYYRWQIATTGAITYWCSVTTIRESPMSMTWLTDDSFPS